MALQLLDVMRYGIGHNDLELKLNKISHCVLNVGITITENYTLFGIHYQVSVYLHKKREIFSQRKNIL